MVLPYKAIIVENELNARELLKSMLEGLNLPVNVTAEASGVAEGLEKISKLDPGVLFLDVELNDGNAFDLLSQLEDYKGQLIFTTAYDHYALNAIRFCAVDYLLKPLSPSDLKRAVSRLKPADPNQSTIQSQISELLNNMGLRKKKRKIAIVSQDNIRFIKVETIIRCTSEGNYTWIYTVNGEKLISTRILKDYQSLLEDCGFFRIHHKHLINLEKISEYIKGDQNLVVMQNGDRLTVSRRKKTEFMDALGMID